MRSDEIRRAQGGVARRSLLPVPAPPLPQCTTSSPKGTSHWILVSFGGNGVYFRARVVEKPAGLLHPLAQLDAEGWVSSGTPAHNKGKVQHQEGGRPDTNPNTCPAPSARETSMSRASDISAALPQVCVTFYRNTKAGPTISSYSHRSVHTACPGHLPSPGTCLHPHTGRGCFCI